MKDSDNYKTQNCPPAPALMLGNNKRQYKTKP